MMHAAILAVVAAFNIAWIFIVHPPHVWVNVALASVCAGFAVLFVFLELKDRRDE